MNSDAADPLIGRLVDGRYRVDEQVARGGMATVYRATDTRLDRVIALKVMHPSFAEDPDFVARFAREARAAARLADPHIVKVFDQGQDGNTMYLAMEYIPSRTLRDVLNERTRLPVDEALAVINPVLQALAAAHAESVVHRDVKPENVLIGSNGHVYVTDFGLARATNSSSTQHITSGLLLGTVAYLSPEQVKPGVSDERSDVYSAGIVLYEMLTGTPPFTGTEAISVAYRHVNEDVPKPSASGVAVGAELDDVVLIATRRDPNQRPVDAAALLKLVRDLPPPTTPVDLQQTMVVPIAVGAAALQHDTTVHDVPAGEPAVGETASTAAAPSSDATPGPSAKSLDPAAHRKRSRRRGLIALAVVLVLALGAGVFAWWLGTGRYTTVPRLTGLTAQAAEAQLESEGLSADFADEQFSEIVKAGQVISSDPEQGAEVRSGGTVTLVLSKGPERYDVPNVVGKELDAAKEQIKKRNLAVGDVTRKYSDSVDKGLVLSAQPKAGTSVRVDTAVDLVVSKGPAPVAVPNLSGDSVDSARSQLAEIDLKLSQGDQEYNNKVPAGAIISQSPASGTLVAPGSTVSVVVSLGPPLVKVPDVVDMPLEQAIAELKQAGFKYKTFDLFGVSPLNRVATQDPGGGTEAPKGSVIELGLV
ncbi:MAG TPA: Stk1 family PASTA domain-containing Ser/Thr kinase [Actinomycetes bacterium]|nr:Stk1 family PASTA domain-containing Ser/Thr kinase [Actinomycetes bacterium]